MSLCRRIRSLYASFKDQMEKNTEEWNKLWEKMEKNRSAEDLNSTVLQAKTLSKIERQLVERLEFTFVDFPKLLKELEEMCEHENRKREEVEKECEEFEKLKSSFAKAIEELQPENSEDGFGHDLNVITKDQDFTPPKEVLEEVPPTKPMRQSLAFTIDLDENKIVNKANHPSERKQVAQAADICFSNLTADNNSYQDIDDTIQNQPFLAENFETLENDISTNDIPIDSHDDPIQVDSISVSLFEKMDEKNDESQLKELDLTEDSIFNNEIGQKFNVSDGPVRVDPEISSDKENQSSENENHQLDKWECAVQQDDAVSVKDDGEKKKKGNVITKAAKKIFRRPRSLSRARKN